MNEHHQGKQPMTLRRKVLAGIAIVAGVAGLVGSGIMVRHRAAEAGGTASAEATSAAVEGGALPASLTGGCVAITRPVGFLRMHLTMGEFIGAMKATGGVVKWEGSEGGGGIVRVTTADQLKRTSHETDFQFDPVVLGVNHCFAASRLLADGQERSLDEIWTVMNDVVSRVHPLTPDSPPWPPTESASTATPASAAVGDEPTSSPEANEAAAKAARAVGVAKSMAYAAARQRLIAAGFKPDTEIDNYVTLFKAYPELDCAADQPLCTGTYTAPSGGKVNIEVQFDEGPDDDAPMRTVAVVSVEPGD